MLTDQAVSQQDYDDADAALKQVDADIASWKAQIETARINLGYDQSGSLRSPDVSGKSSVTDGALVTAYQATALASIRQFDPILRRRDAIDQRSAALAAARRSGALAGSGRGLDKVRLILEDGTPYEQEGTPQFRDVSVEPSTGSVVLRMIFPNPKGILLPEMFVRAEIKEGSNDAAICVPQQSVMRNTKGLSPMPSWSMPRTRLRCAR